MKVQRGILMSGDNALYDELTRATRANWDHLRSLVYAAYNDQSGICHASKHISGVTLHCDEIWQYDDEHHVQGLAGFIALCEMCHHCKHIRLAAIHTSERTLDFQHVIAHFTQVNQCSYEEYKVYSQEAWDTWHERNTHHWVTDLGIYGNLVTQL